MTPTEKFSAEQKHTTPMLLKHIFSDFSAQKKAMKIIQPLSCGGPVIHAVFFRGTLVALHLASAPSKRTAAPGTPAGGAGIIGTDGALEKFYDNFVGFMLFYLYNCLVS